MADRVVDPQKPHPEDDVIGARVPEPVIQRVETPEEEEEEKRAEAEASLEAPQPEAEEVPAEEPPAEAEPEALSAEEEKEEEEEDLIQADGYRGPSGQVDPATEERVQGIRAGGRPLPDDVRATLEPRFGFDFSAVRIHNNSEAGSTAQAIGARAFTIGRDIVFGPSEFAPDSAAGQHLLAHELTHVVQQSGGQGGSVNGGTVLRAPVVEADPAEEALKTAVKGDDDDVRALTQDDFWAGVNLTANSAAELIDNLLTGPTLDEDEEAGLKVLNKTKEQNVLDKTLLELDSRDRFRKLLDDYHGRQYHDLLEFLSQSIEGQDVKAIYLDAFVAMWWVRKHEEKAIVVLLERTTAADVAALLDTKNRRPELRKAIDADDLAKRYEAVASQASEATFGQLSTRLARVFEITAKTSVGSTTQAGEVLTEKHVEELLKAAAEDLKSELEDYKEELNAATTAGDRDKIAEINRRFEARIENLITQKRREFKYELRWNLEFNRGLKAAYRRQWTESDLKEIDKLLAQIPPEILLANPRLKGFARESEHPEHSGQASKQAGFITLSGRGLNLGTAAHEVGHFAHFADDPLFNDFVQISGWQPFTSRNFRMFIAEERTRQRILRKLNKHRKDDSTYDTVKHENHVYRYNRYDGTGSKYYRFKSSAKFITRYAGTDPQDDFAESFEAYLLKPESLKKAAREKYAFMHKRVFVEFWLTQQKDRIVKSFSARARERLGGISDRYFGRWLGRNHIHPLRRDLGKELDDLKVEMLDAVEAGLLMKPVPLKGSTATKTIAEKFMARLDGIINLAVQVQGRSVNVNAEADALKERFPQAQQPAARTISLDLKRHFREESRKLLNASAEDLKRGKKIDPAAWPELDTLVANFKASVAVVPTYLPYLQQFQKIQSDWNLEQDLMSPLPVALDFDPLAQKALSTIPPSDPRHGELRIFIIEERDKLVSEFRSIERDLMELVRAGGPYKPGALPDPLQLTRAYRKTVRAFAKKLQRQSSRRQKRGP